MELSSPRAENTRAVTGRRSPHSGIVEDFLAHQPFFSFSKTAITRKRKVEKLIPRLEMNRLSERYKQAVDHNWGCMAKSGFFWPKTARAGWIKAKSYREKYTSNPC